MKNVYPIAMAIISILIIKSFSLAHCEIPCGIYDDAMRIHMIQEHIATIEKSMNSIIALEKENKNANQLTRWVVNKEDHANKLQEIVSQYFMTQRIKPDTKKYGKKLELLHGMLIQAMKCKQGVDLEHVEALKKLTAEFETLYFEK